MVRPAQAISLQLTTDRIILANATSKNNSVSYYRVGRTKFDCGAT